MRALALGVFVWPLLVAAARADAPARGELVWDASMVTLGCPSRDVTETATAAQLGRDAFAGTARVEFVVRAAAERSADGGVRVVIALARADGTPLGERTLETREATCAPIADGLGVVLAIMADLGAHAVTVTAPRRAEQPPRRPADVDRGPLAFAVMLGVAGELGVFQMPDVAGRVRVELAPRGFVPIGLTLQQSLPMRAGDARIEVLDSLAGLDVMPRVLDLPWIDLAVGGGVEVGIVAGRATRDVADAKLVTYLLVALDAGARLAVTLGGPWQLALDVRAGVPLRDHRPRWVIAGAPDVADTGDVFGRVELSFGYRFR